MSEKADPLVIVGTILFCSLVWCLVPVKNPLNFLIKLEGAEFVGFKPVKTDFYFPGLQPFADKYTVLNVISAVIVLIVNLFIFLCNVSLNSRAVLICPWGTAL